MADAAIDGAPASPGCLQGVWRREGRSLAGRPMAEVSQVVWAQAGDWFVDVRQPRGDGGPLSHLDEAQAFGGVARWRDGTVTWNHDLDTMARPSGHGDRAEVELDGAVLIERGPGYEERWRLDGPPGQVSVLERRDPAGVLTARLVSVDDVYALVWAGRRPGGAALRFAEEGWEVEACVGRGAIPWPAVLAARAGQVPAGWWRVPTSGDRAGG